MLPLYLTYLEEYDDKKQFEKIFRDYRKQMVFYAMSILKNESDAEDAVHDVFLRLARNWGSVKMIDNPIDLRNYLLKATKNSSLNIMKKNSRENITLDTIIEFDFDSEPSVSDEEFIDMICAKMEYQAIVVAMTKLKETYRCALYYHFVLELSVKETAKVMGQTTTATKQQLIRGKKALLDMLGIKGGGDNVNE